jgi:hypothetical protein
LYNRGCGERHEVCRCSMACSKPTPQRMFFYGVHPECYSGMSGVSMSNGSSSSVNSGSGGSYLVV